MIQTHSNARRGGMRNPVRSAPALRAAFSSYPHAAAARPSPVLIRIAPAAGGSSLDAAPSSAAGRRSTRTIIAVNAAIAFAVLALLGAAEWCARVAFDTYHHHHRLAAVSIGWQLALLVAAAALHWLASYALLHCDLSRFRPTPARMLSTILFAAPLLAGAARRAADLYSAVYTTRRVADEVLAIVSALVFALAYAAAAAVWFATRVLSAARTIVCLLSASFALLVLLNMQLFRARASRPMGLGASAIDAAHPCALEHRATSLLDVLPLRLLALFAGAERCTRLPEFASIHHHKLVVNRNLCRGLLQREPLGPSDDVPLGDIHFSLNTKTWSLSGSDDDAAATIRIAKLGSLATERRVHSRSAYKAPVLLKGVEYVDVWCGTNHNFLVHNWPNETKVAKLRVGGRREGSRRPDIAILMFDELSRRHFHRSMRATRAILERLAASPNYAVFQFFRYMPVGADTRSNLMPMLTGDFGLVGAEQQRRSASAPINASAAAKASPFVWDYFEQSGYAKAFLLNHCENYFKTLFGNRNPQLDHHYVRAFCHSDGGGAGGAHSVGDSGGFGRRCAAGGRHAHELTFDYVEQLWDNYANRPKFAFASLVEAREQSATATGGAVDADLAHFVEHMTHTPQHKAHGRSKFSDTFLFLLADHGPVSADPLVDDKGANRGNGDREDPDEPTSLSASLSSDGGAAEHRLPAFFLIAPRTYLDAHLWIEPALRQNEQQIVTAFDVFATLADLATLGSSDPNFEPPRVGAHARTLFAPIERERTCADARIDAAMCACAAETGQRQAARAAKAEIAMESVRA